MSTFQNFVRFGAKCLGAKCPWGILSWGILSVGQNVLGAKCLLAFYSGLRHGGCRGLDDHGGLGELSHKLGAASKMRMMFVVNLTNACMQRGTVALVHCYCWQYCLHRPGARRPAQHRVHHLVSSSSGLRSNSRWHSRTGREKHFSNMN